jgi:GntR family transcriptional regulator of vanillate catabolism
MPVARQVTSPDREERSSQTVRALLALRNMLLSAEIAPGERISELSMVGRLGVSRTPVRSALARLEAEGFLEAIPSGGYAVKSFTARDAFEAIEVRGLLEGLCARLAAERGVKPAQAAPLRDTLAAIDEIVATAADRDADEYFPRYVDLNAIYHEQLIALADSPIIERQLAMATALPFASASGFVMAQSTMRNPLNTIIVAQDQHRCIIEAIEAREGQRAEALAREHARVAFRNLRFALQNQRSMALVRGGGLIQPHAIQNKSKKTT